MPPSKLALALSLCAGLAQAQGGLSPDQERLLELRLRDMILDGADAARSLIAPRPLGPEARGDLDRIAANQDALFMTPDRIGPADRRADFAVFYDPADTGLIAALSGLAKDHGLSIALHPAPEAMHLAQELGLDIWPSYVFPDLMLRGDVPVPLLVRYVPRRETKD